jgi:hypothetical protein
VNAISTALANSLRREFAPSPEEEASQFYRRGTKYNAVGGMKGTHAWALAWHLCITLPLFLISLVVIEVPSRIAAARRARSA